jgi:cytochrome d ubiquinol oxidase subunit II
MTDFVASIGLPEIVAGLMALALNLYVLMGGADFGGGLWDLLAAGPRREAQRELIAGAIAPIWEANHVWLIVVVVLLFTAFPVAFATLGIVLHVPLAILLVGIVMRGAAFVFRSYGSRTQTHRRRWGLIFAIASTMTPVLLGIVVGAVASGDVAAAAGMVGSVATPFGHTFVDPWFSPFPVAVGCFALALFAFLAAVYLALAAQDPEVQNDFRRRALAMAVGVFVCAFVALLLARSAAPRVASGVIGSTWAIALHLCTAAAALTAIGALWRHAFRVARIAAVAQVSLILWGWVVAQYPFLIPPTLTIREAAAPAVTLKLLLVGLVVGAAILVPSLRYLFKTFSSPDGTAEKGSMA